MAKKPKHRDTKSTVNRWLEEQDIGGQLLDDEFKGSKHKHNWKCVICSNTYEATFEAIKDKWKRRTYPCSNCHPNQKQILFCERQVRFAFQYLTEEYFPKTSPAWLINDRSGSKMHLDGYCKKLELAFEYDGEQHNERRKDLQTKEEFEAQQYRDALKDKLCQDNGVHLIRVNAKDEYFKNPRLIADSISKHALHYLKHEEVDWNEYNSRVDFDLVKEAEEYAESHGGECRTEEIYDRKQKILFYCPKHNHEWENSLNVINARKQKSWCQKCGYEKGANKNTKKFSSKNLEEIAKSFDPKLKCREELGKNGNEEYLWQCEKCNYLTPKNAKDLELMAGKNANANKDKLKHPCIKCNKKRRTQVWEMHQHAEKWGGKCLYLELDFPGDKMVKFDCFNPEHEIFQLTYSQVINFDMWCPDCPTSRNKRVSHSRAAALAKSCGFELLDKYAGGNTKPLRLKCTRDDCGAINTNSNLKKLQRMIPGGNYCDSCRDL